MITAGQNASGGPSRESSRAMNDASSSTSRPPSITGIFPRILTYPTLTPASPQIFPRARAMSVFPAYSDVDAMYSFIS